MAKTKEKTEKKEKSLVIVESPAKAKTIKKILGDSFQIEASYGHIRDFPKKIMGFDADNDFALTFEVIPEKEKVVKKLNDAAKTVDNIYLAPDPDREGEAIAWHIAEVLNTKGKNLYRIEFNEITKNAIQNAVVNPRPIDIDRVYAQQTRQVLDRLVGYKLSPLLWDKLKNRTLSAGRVQSVALKLICEREKEIEAFVPVEFWTINADFKKGKSEPFIAELTKYQDKKIELNNQADSDQAVADLSAKGVEFTVDKITVRNSQRKPSAPFITSTLQREASNKLGYGVGKTMQVAQKLYEGIELGDKGPVGLITYMRTDSTRISDEATDAAKEYILNAFGEKFYPTEPNVYAKKGKNVQDAHEAIRPTYIEYTPDSIKQYLNSEQYKVYKLIWEKFIASQMANAAVENTSIEIEGAKYTFRLGASKVTFKGFLAVQKDDEELQKAEKMPDLQEGDKVDLLEIHPKQNFTQPPARYTEASLVKILEEYGIGRPSTYAPIISKIQQKNYVIKEEKSLLPTQLGRTVDEQLGKHFDDIINYEFTANMENQLDEIAEKATTSTKVLTDFYQPFIDKVAEASEKMEKVDILTGEMCPNCGKPLALRTSRWGTQFLGCTGYPECKTSVPLTKDQKKAPDDRPSDEKCEKCGGEMVIRYGPYGDYLLCKNEDCKNKQKLIVKTGVKCPKCDGELIQKRSRYGKIFYGCNKYPNCDVALWGEPTGEKCPECGSLLELKHYKKGDVIKCSSKECKYTKPTEE
jgi:DNA topoisomerase-1